MKWLESCVRRSMLDPLDMLDTLDSRDAIVIDKKWKGRRSGIATESIQEKEQQDSKSRECWSYSKWQRELKHAEGFPRHGLFV